jgi:uncharacterized protein with PIN domain
VEIRFHLDENVHGAIAKGLRLRGVDVTTTHEAGLIGASDEDHLAFALAQKRVVVTHDDDFLRLVSGGAAHAGIVYSAPRHLTIGQTVHGLMRLWRKYSAENFYGRVEFI